MLLEVNLNLIIGYFLSFWQFISCLNRYENYARDEAECDEEGNLL